MLIAFSLWLSNRPVLPTSPVSNREFRQVLSELSSSWKATITVAVGEIDRNPDFSYNASLDMADEKRAHLAKDSENTFAPKKPQIEEDVERLKSSLGRFPEPMVSPPFIVVSGLPGTGKSFFCRKLASKFPACIVESDAMRKVLFPSPQYSAAENARLFAACHLLIRQLLSNGIPVIFDATNLSERHRERLYHIADRVGTRLFLIRVIAPPSVTRERLQARKEHRDPEDKSDADLEVYNRMAQKVDKIWRNHFVVDTSQDIAPALEKILKAIAR